MCQSVANSPAVLLHQATCCHSAATCCHSEGFCCHRTAATCCHSTASCCHSSTVTCRASSAQHNHAPYFLLMQAHCVLMADLPFQNKNHSSFMNVSEGDRCQRGINRFCPIVQTGTQLWAAVSIESKDLTGNFVDGGEGNSCQQT